MLNPFITDHYKTFDIEMSTAERDLPKNNNNIFAGA